MDSKEFILYFSKWIKNHTTIDALYMIPEMERSTLIALTSHKSLFLQNFMIFSDYSRTVYCKLYNCSDEIPYLEIEFQSGHKALIEFISDESKINKNMKVLFDRR